MKFQKQNSKNKVFGISFWNRSEWPYARLQADRGSRHGGGVVTGSGTGQRIAYGRTYSVRYLSWGLAPVGNNEKFYKEKNPLIFKLMVKFLLSIPEYPYIVNPFKEAVKDRRQTDSRLIRRFRKVPAICAMKAAYSLPAVVYA